MSYVPMEPRGRLNEQEILVLDTTLTLAPGIVEPVLEMLTSEPDAKPVPARSLTLTVVPSVPAPGVTETTVGPCVDTIANVAGLDAPPAVVTFTWI